MGKKCDCFSVHCLYHLCRFPIESPFLYPSLFTHVLFCRLLWHFIKRWDKDHECNSNFVDVLTFLINQGANPFELLDGSCSLGLFLQKFKNRLSDSLMPSITTFLGMISQKCGDYAVNECILCVPAEIFAADSKYVSSFNNLISRICVQMDEKNPVLWQESVTSHGTPGMENLRRKIDEVNRCFQEKGANDQDATQRLPHVQ